MRAQQLSQLLSQVFLSFFSTAFIEAAADKLDNFQFVAVRKHNPGPTGTRNNVAVAFDGNAVGLQLKQFEEAVELGVRVQLRKFTITPIDCEIHWIAIFIWIKSFIWQAAPCISGFDHLDEDKGSTATDFDCEVRSSLR